MDVRKYDHTHATAQPDSGCEAHVHDARGLSTHLADAPAEHEGGIVRLALLPAVPRIGKRGRFAGVANAAPDEGRGGVLKGAVQERRGAGDGENGGRGTRMEEDLCEDLKGERGQRHAVCTRGGGVAIESESASLGGHGGRLWTTL